MKTHENAAFARLPIRKLRKSGVFYVYFCVYKLLQRLFNLRGDAFGGKTEVFQHRVG